MFKKRIHITIANYRSVYEYGFSIQAGRCLDYPFSNNSNKHNRKCVATLHSEINVLLLLFKKWGLNKFLKRIPQIYLVSLAFKIDLENNIIKLVSAKPCKGCCLTFLNINLKNISFSDDFGKIKTMSVKTLYNISTFSFGDRYNIWIRDCNILNKAITKNAITNLYIN